MRHLSYVPAYVLSLFALPFTALAQLPAAKPLPAVDNAFVQKEFGTNCVVNPNPVAIPLIADFNGDGIEDIVIPARCKDPMLDAAEFKYTVLDPSNAFFGFGDPKITTQFSASDPDKRSLTLLVIHGVGPEAWHSSEPRPKFLLVNLPYEQITLKRIMLKKKKVNIIYALETDTTQFTSFVFWDGKKYKYQPIGQKMD